MQENSEVLLQLHRISPCFKNFLYKSKFEIRVYRNIYDELKSRNLKNIQNKLIFKYLPTNDIIIFKLSNYFNEQ